MVKGKDIYNYIYTEKLKQIDRQKPGSRKIIRSIWNHHLLYYVSKYPPPKKTNKITTNKQLINRSKEKIMHRNHLQTDQKEGLHIEELTAIYQEITLISLSLSLSRSRSRSLSPSLSLPFLLLFTPTRLPCRIIMHGLHVGHNPYAEPSCITLVQDYHEDIPEYLFLIEP